MRIHISNLYGLSGGSATAAAMQSVTKVASEFAKDVGMEISIYRYPCEVDSERELSKRLDGVISSVSVGDIVILQLPTWNDTRFEEHLIQKLKVYKTTLIMFIHDVVPLQFDSGKEKLQRAVEMYNQADVLILPSKNMYKRLVEAGLTVEKICYQTLFDYVVDADMDRHAFLRKMIFTGSPKRFPFINEYHGTTPIDLYGLYKANPGANTVYQGQRMGTSLLLEMSKGGFGLVWAEDNQYEYYKMNLPFKVTTFLAAGIPLIIRKGIHIEDYVVKHKVGFAVDSLSEADEIVQTITEEQYGRMLENVKKVQFLITHGYYTRKVLVDAIVMAVEGSI